MPITMKSNKLTGGEVKHIADLANLRLSEEEITKFGTQLSSVLDYIDKLQAIDVKNTQPTNQITGLKDIVEEDFARPSLEQLDALSGAKKKHNSNFQVKAVFEE